MTHTAHRPARGKPRTGRRYWRSIALLAAGAVGLTGLAAPAQAAPGDPGLTNLALGATITASVPANADPNSELANAIDGDPATQFKTVNNPVTSNQAYPVDITVEFDELATLDSYRITFGWGYPMSYSLSTSIDGVAWTDPVHVTEPNDQDDPLVSQGSLSGAIPAKFVKVSLATIRGYDGNFWNYEVKEIELWGTDYEAPVVTQEPVDLARFAQPSATRTESGFEPFKAIDGNPSTRWSTGHLDDVDVQLATESYTLNLGTNASLDSVKLNWEYSYAVDYTIAVADSEAELATASPAITVTDSDGDVDTEDFPAATEGQWVRITMTKQRENWWDVVPHFYGYSFFSFEVWGVPDNALASLATRELAADAGEDVQVDILLSKKLAAPSSVKIETIDGTATAGTDYTATSRTVVVPANTLQVSTTIETNAASTGGTFSVGLSDPGSGIDAVSGAGEVVVTLLRAAVSLPPVGGWVPFVDYENGDPYGYPWGDDSPGNIGNKPILEVVDGDRTPESTKVLQVVKSSDTSWGGFSNDFASTRNWKHYDGFRFWFKGTNSGKTLTYQLKSEGKTFETDYVDDSTDWKSVEIAFRDLRNKDNATDRFNPMFAGGFAFGFGGFGGTVYIDDLELRERVGDVETFDGTVTITTEADPVGVYPWANESSNLPVVAVTEDSRGGAADAGNKVLAGTYEITAGGWGGVTQNFDAAQDWSSYRGIRFWWYASQESNPASPTAGPDIKFEIRTGGLDGANSALYQTTFKDNWGSSTSRWKLIEIPFNALQRRTDYQPGPAPSDPKPNLSKGWGWSLTFPTDTAETGWKVDSLQVYGASSSPDDITVSVDPGVVLVDNGETAVVKVAARSDDGEPLASDVSVAVATFDGSAVAGTDYTATTSTVEFEDGDESGTVKTVEVPTTAVTGSSVAKEFGISLVPSTGESAGDGKVVINAHGLPYLDDSLSNEARAADLLSRMTLDEKVGQMAQGERLALQPNSIAGLGLGSVLSGGGSVPANNTPTGWADMVDGYQREALSTRLQIPLIYGVDAVHGHSNVIGATILPHNIGLGATRDPAVIEAGMKVTAQEVRATGIPWTFAPTVAVTRDERWGRSYESFGEDPAIVSIYAKQAVEGLQGTNPNDLSGANTVLATAKHWAGDGGTEYGTGTGGYTLDQGVTKAATMQEFLDLHASPYDPALAAGVGSIMPSYSAVQIGDDTPIRMHVHKELNTDILKDQLGFKGFLISDWEGIDKVAGLPTNLGGLGGGAGVYKQAAIDSVNAGMDMMMAPYNFATFIQAVKDGVAEDKIELSRIDDAVTRILVQKFALGLFDQPFAERANVDNVGSDANREVAREAAAKSQVLLKNDGGTLPLSADQSIYVAGSSADNLGRQMGGWTISWQGGSGQTTDGTTIGQAIKAVGGDNVTIGSGVAAPADNYDVGVVVVGERPYAEGIGDVGNPASPDLSLSLSTADKNTITSVASKVDKLVVLVVSGRPQVIDTAQLGDIDALVASWLPGSEGEGVADVLFGDVPFSGSLSVTWPANASQVPINVGDATYAPAYPFGWGLRTDSARERLESLAGSLPAGAQQLLDSILADASLWSPDGSLANEAAGLREVQRLVALLSGADDVAAAATAASIARDAAVAEYTVADAKAFAEAERLVISGSPAQGVVALAAVAGITLDPADSVVSADASLVDLKINGTTVAGFAPDKTSYELTLPQGASVPVVTATAKEIASVVVVTPANALPGDTQVKVTAPNGVATKTYTVKFLVKAGPTPPGTEPGKFTSAGKVTVRGVHRYGRTLTARVTGTAPKAQVVTYQWLRNGKAIKNATAAKYTLGRADVGKRVRVKVTVHRTGFVNASASSPAKAVGKAKTAIRQKVRVSGKRVIVTVRVRTAATARPTGKVVVRVGKKRRVVTLRARANGTVRVVVRESRAGRYKVSSGLRATKVLAKSSAKAKTVRVR